MTNIAKLKQEAEAAFAEAEQQLYEAIDRNEHWARDRYNRTIVAAMMAQMAVQTAEKEAEARKYDPLVYRNDEGVWVAKSDPAPIADGTWIQHGGNGCPIPYARYVQIKRRDGTFESNTASKFYWEWSGKKLAGTDPIAYRIITPAADRVSES